MRVLIVSKFYYPRGGDCIAAINTARLLRQHGHNVGVFTMQFPENIADPDILATVPEVTFTGSFAQRLAATRRTLGLDNTHRTFADTLRKFQPDVVHLHNIHSYLSPALAREARHYGCRVVWTMHDYKLLCPVYTALRCGQPCFDCANGSPHHVVAHRCMKNSRSASIAAWVEAKRWNRDNLSQWVDTFICPSRFLAQQMEHAGYKHEQLAVLDNFNLADKPVATDRESYVCYVGRISPEKGIATLLQAIASTDIDLRIAGDGPLREKLQLQYASARNISWLGHLASDEVAELISRAHAVVAPSLWHENNPLSVVEALCAGTPVVATHMGGLPELIDTSNGILVDSSDPDALSAAIRTALDRRWNHSDIAAEAAKKFSPEQHYSRLFAIYDPNQTS